MPTACQAFDERRAELAKLKAQINGRQMDERLRTRIDQLDKKILTARAACDGERARDAKNPKTKPVPAYGTMGLAEPVSDWTGLILWNFADGSKWVDDNQQRALNSQFLLNVKNSKKKYQLVGHTSGIGLDAVTPGLDVARARAARDVLIASGVPKETFVRTYGQKNAKPLDNDMAGGQPSAKGAARNRRVEFLPVDDELAIPDDVVDGLENIGDVRGTGDQVTDKLPPGKSSENAKWLTIGGIAAEAVTATIEVVFIEGGAAAGGYVAAGAVGVILVPALMMMKHADAWAQAEKEGQRRGVAHGFRLGAWAAPAVLRTGAARVTASELYTRTKSGIEAFGNQAVPLDPASIKWAVSLGVEQSAGVVNRALELAEAELLKLLQAKFDGKSAKAIYDANVAKIRVKVAWSLAYRIEDEVKAILSAH